MTDFNEKLAKLAVIYSVKVKPGEIFLIRRRKSIYEAGEWKI